MQPRPFKQSMTYIAENQPEYLTLPAHKDKDGVITSCWSLTFYERVKILFSGKLFLQVMTFNQQLQPQKPSASNPLTGVGSNEHR